jgi:hypothetical protein
MKDCIKWALVFLILIFSLSGCSVSHMALTNGKSIIDTSSKSIALLSVKISNKNKPGYQPSLDHAFIVPKDNPSTIPMARRKYMFIADDPYRSEPDSYKEYLLSFSLEPGIHYFNYLAMVYNVPLLLSARCDIYLNMKKDIRPNSVVYLGHVDAVIREKKNGEETNCGIFPLIDQATVGFSSGFLEVKISDDYEDDVKLFKTAYPGLNNVVIEKLILPPWRNINNKYISDIKLAE